jgi:hypothetical protein
VTSPVQTLASVIGAASLVVKAAPGAIFSLRVRNRSGVTVFAMLFDSATVPADGAVTPLVPPFPIATLTDFIVGNQYFTQLGLPTLTGIAVAVSTTDASTKTLAGTPANFDISAIFI